jgi:hypothetical protein
MNVPLSTTLLTYGMALLFLLWYVMPEGFLSQGERLSSPAVRQVPATD